MNEINLGITLLIGGVGTLLWYLITKQISRMEDDIKERKSELVLFEKVIKKDFEKVWVEMKDFKENYLDRFDKVNTNINASREALLEMMHKIELKIK